MKVLCAGDHFIGDIHRNNPGEPSSKRSTKAAQPASEVKGKLLAWTVCSTESVDEKARCLFAPFEEVIDVAVPVSALNIEKWISCGSGIPSVLHFLLVRTEHDISCGEEPGDGRPGLRSRDWSCR